MAHRETEQVQAMPTYEYRCSGGHTFDLFQKMSDDPQAQCPECGAESQRIISGGAGFLFKGDGFYITDYRSDSYKKEASKEASPSVESSTKKKPDTSDSKKDSSSSKPAGKAASSGS